MKNELKVETWLPVFSGFYNTIWECSSEEFEVDHINDERKELGLEPITYDECEFDYAEYNLQVVKGIAKHLESEFEAFISGIEVQKITSPREYNFYNDSCNVVITLSRDNKKNIGSYLAKNIEAFKQYLKDRYTSCSGFISSYPNDMETFMRGYPLENVHKLGSILEFIFKNEDSEIELNTYYNVEAYISVSNYDELVPAKV